MRLVRPYSLCFEEYDSIMSEAQTLKVTIINHYKDLSDQINAAIQDAEQVAANSNATQKQLDAAARKLAAQIAKLEAKVEARKSLALLQNEVQEARGYYNAIKDISEYQEVAAVLLDSIQYAEWVIKMSAGDNHTKEYIDEARDKLATDLAKAKADVAAVNALVFAEEKTAQKAAADSLAKADDSAACDQLIKKAKADIDALAYDTIKTLAENKAALQAIVTRLEQDLKAQRAADLKKSKDALTAGIADATTFYNEIKDTTDYADIAAELNDAIVAAQAVLDDSDATRIQLDKATETLKAAEDKAKEEVAKIEAAKLLEESKQTLTDSIAAALNFLDEIKDNEEYADIAAELQAEIEAVQAILDNPESTQEEIDSAIERIAKAAAKARQSAGGHEGIEEIFKSSTAWPIDRNSQIFKFFRAGQLYIIRNGKTYTATGAEVR